MLISVHFSTPMLTSKWPKSHHIKSLIHMINLQHVFCVLTNVIYHLNCTIILKKNVLKTVFCYSFLILLFYVDIYKQ